MKTGFEKDHRPVTKLPRTVKSGPQLNTVWSFKTNTPKITVLGNLTVDALVHFEVNPKIEAISSYPLHFPYWTFDKKGFRIEKTHRPQLGIRYHPQNGQNQGRIVYIDIIPWHLRQKKGEGLKRKIEELRKAFQDALMAGYNVLDETSLMVEPLRGNLSVMHWHLKGSVEKQKARVRSVLMSLPAPTTIGTVRAATGLRAPWYEIKPKDVVTFRRHLTEVDYAFTSLMQMAAHGEVRLDLSRPFDDNTLVTFTPVKGGYR